MIHTYKSAACLAALLFVQAVNGSPYRDSFVGVTVNDYDWGFWRIVDVPADPDRGPFPIADENEKIRFLTYWCFGLGPYVKLQLTQGVGISVVLLIVALASLRIYQKRKTDRTSRLTER